MKIDDRNVFHFIPAILYHEVMDIVIPKKITSTEKETTKE
jgi:hypothetical protein